MTNVNDYLRLAEDDGARLQRGAETGRWMAVDTDGVVIVQDAMSKAEAARLYCEDKALVAPDYGRGRILIGSRSYSPEDILDGLLSQYRPHHVLDEFWDGFKAGYQGARHRNPYHAGKTVKAKAWDRGFSTARRYRHALAAKTGPQADSGLLPAWMIKLSNTGRR